MANTQVSEFRPVITATPGTPCGWVAYGETGTKLTCHGAAPAIHVLTETLPVAKAGTALCGYHSPFNPTDEERQAVGVPFKTKGQAGAEILAAKSSTTPEGYCLDGKCGECADCVECAAIVEPTPGFDEAMAEAERDEMTGIDMIRELVTLTPVRTPKAAKVATVHLGAFNGATACGRKITARVNFSAVTGEATCKTCKGTARFANMAYSEARKAAQAVWARAGLQVGMVVRHIATGRFGMINELGESIRIGYWVADPRSVFSRLEDFDRACQIVTAEDLVTKGTRLVSNLGGEAVVEELGSAGIWAYVGGETGARAWTLSEFAAEISRGWLAVVPPTPTMVMSSVSGRHVVTAFDLAEVGYQVTVAAGSPRNGVIVQVSPWGALVRSNGGDIYWGLSLAEMVNGSVGIWLADGAGRRVGSWR